MSAYAQTTTNWRPIATAAAIALLVAFAGGLITDLGPWYQTLQQPAWKPADWLFAPAWTVIFACAAASAVVAWRRLGTTPARVPLVAMFAVNGLLNILWSVLFFQQHRPDYALLEVALLWLSIAVLMAILWRPARTASVLLIPYLLWVTVAGVLNYDVVRLNAPF